MAGATLGRNATSGSAVTVGFRILPFVVPVNCIRARQETWAKNGVATGVLRRIKRLATAHQRNVNVICKLLKKQKPLGFAPLASVWILYGKCRCVKVCQLP